MSLEQTLGRIATALEVIANKIDNAPTVKPAEQPKKKKTPKPAEMPTPPAVAAVPPPAAPEAAPAADAPFKDAASLNKYVMDTYTEMGAEQGAKIANVLTAMGLHNIKEVTPERYGEFYAGVEELKASA